jgi:hypothetical protein
MRRYSFRRSYIPYKICKVGKNSPQKRFTRIGKIQILLLYHDLTGEKVREMQSDIIEYLEFEKNDKNKRREFFLTCN